MISRKEFLKNHWCYYLMLEHNFINTINYVDLDEDNKTTYSNEYALLLQSIGAELDNFFKVYCDSKVKTITQYRKKVKRKYPTINSQKVKVIGYNVNYIEPYKEWIDVNSNNPLFWMAFCKIKHNRCKNKKMANQSNVLNALGALFLLEMKYLSDITKDTEEPDIPDKKSVLFELDDWTFRYDLMSEQVVRINESEMIIESQKNFR